MSQRMTMRRILTIVTSIALLAGCADDGPDDAERASTDSLRNAVAVEIRQAEARDRAERLIEEEQMRRQREADARRRCSALERMPASLAEIIEEPKLYAATDSCAAKLMDEIVARFVRTNEKQYLTALDALSRAGDGKTNELLGGAVLDLFRARPVKLVQHLYSLQGDPTATDVDALLVSEIQLGRNSAFDDEITRILHRLENGAELSTDQKRYLSRIESQFWASAR